MLGYSSVSKVIEHSHNHDHKPSTQEAAPRRPEIQHHPWLHSSMPANDTLYLVFKAIIKKVNKDNYDFLL